MVETSPLPVSPRFLGIEESREASDGGSEDELARRCVSKFWMLPSDDVEMQGTVAEETEDGAEGASAAG